MKYLDIHTHVNVEDQDVISITSLIPGDELPKSLFSIGVHPWLIEKDEIENTLESIAQTAELEQCVAIGECGLDRPTFKKSGQTIQEEVFKKQIRIANLANKPLIIHCVRAFSELLHIHKTENSETPWIIHGFRGSEEEALSLIGKGIYLSFGKSIIYNQTLNNKLLKILTNIPEDRIFLETDNVETPERDIKEVYKKAAEIRNISLVEMGKIIEKNFTTVFGNCF